LNNGLVDDLDDTEIMEFFPADMSNLDVDLSVVVEKKVEAYKDAKKSTGRKIHF